ncbi:MAG: hypothetical protein LBP92_04200 [Deltaproteobacteria bacterium]|jgi:hypothetical protein|nr:hypothetical protein [Deltaproteobacteria bacterium]
MNWSCFIAAETEDELIMASEKNKQISHAADKLGIFSYDQRARELNELRLKEWRDIESFKDDAYAKGEKAGYEQGAKITASNSALKLMELGWPVDEISAVTKLSIEEIEQLSLAR